MTDCIPVVRDALAVVLEAHPLITVRELAIVLALRNVSMDIDKLGEQLNIGPVPMGNILVNLRERGMVEIFQPVQPSTKMLHEWQDNCHFVRHQYVGRELISKLEQLGGEG